MDTVRVLIVDDHPIVRAGIRHLLADDLEAEFTEAKNAIEAIGCCISDRFDLILLDINIPGRSGLDLLGDLKLRWPETPVLILTMHDAPQFVHRSLRAGAAGYVTKLTLEKDLILAVKEILGGGAYVSEELRESATKTVGPLSVEALSPREFEVFRLIVAGKNGTEIASHLSINFKTVSTYRRRLFQKLGARSNVELAQFANHAGLT